MKGAASAREELLNDDVCQNPVLRYAAYRNAFYRQGKLAEIMVSYEPYAAMLNEWWKQLYGESEGKDQKGLLPDSVIFSTDLHSLGQYIQDGSRIMFETVLSVKDSGARFSIPNDDANVDGLNFLSGCELDYVNKQAMLGTLLAHNDGGVPNLLIEMEDRREFSVGYMLYFFELACAVSGYTLGVNPFNQPGVESYKKNMFALLGKPGYEAEKEKLTKRIK
jgi:glucose-6-phosphate isomerase